MLRQVIVRREEKENLEEIKARKEFNKFQKELHEYKTYSAREDYAQLTSEYAFPFDRNRALLSVATYSYGGDITQDNYKELVQMSKKKLLESLDEYINEMETPDTPDDPDADTNAIDD